MKKFVILLVFVLSVSNLLAQKKDILADANRLYTESKFVEAESAYKSLLETVDDEPTRAKIIYNLGMTYQQLTEYDKAIQTFNLIFPMGVNDRERGGSLMQVYRNYRHNAQWEIGNSHFAKGDYQKALNSFQKAKEKYPYRSWCGTCRRSREIIYQKTIGITYESLGRYKEAVNAYFKIHHPRLIELYEFNGQFNDIKEIIKNYEESEILKLQKKYSWTREKAKSYLSTKQLNTVLEIYELERKRNISTLIKLAEKNLRYNNYNSIIITKLLARHPEIVIPQIEKAPNAALHYSVLNYIASPEAMRVLLNKGEKIYNSNDAMAFIDAIDLSGEAGERMLLELEKKELSQNMKWVINRHKTQRLKNKATNDKAFPKLKKVKLPKNIIRDI